MWRRATQSGRGSRPWAVGCRTPLASATSSILRKACQKGLARSSSGTQPPVDSSCCLLLQKGQHSTFFRRVASVTRTYCGDGGAVDVAVQQRPRSKGGLLQFCRSQPTDVDAGHLHNGETGAMSASMLMRHVQCVTEPTRSADYSAGISADGVQICRISDVLLLRLATSHSKQFNKKS